MDKNQKIQNLKKNIEKLKKRKEQLLKEQENLIKEIKKENSRFYDWLISNQVDLRNIGKHTANIAAALTLFINTANPPQQPIETPEPIPQVRTIERNELIGLQEEERAKLVWDRYGHIIRRVADKYGLEPELILATIMLESGGDTQAIRHEPRINDASYGLGQILYGTAKGIGFKGKPTDLYDPEINIELIGRYHKRNLDHYGGNLTPEQLTAVYNTGSLNKKPYPGHLAKFKKWYDRVNQITEV